jgi:hypothetical protein
MTRDPRELEERLAAVEERLRQLEQAIPAVEAAARRRSEDDWHLSGIRSPSADQPGQHAKRAQRPGRSEQRARARRRTAPVIAILVLFWALAALPAALADVSPSPSADPTPTDTASPTDTATPTPTPTDTGTPSPTDTGTPSATDTPTPTDTATPDPTASGGTGGAGGAGGAGGQPTLVLGTPGSDGLGHGQHARAQRHHRTDRQRWAHWRPSTQGTWSTRILDRAAARARHRGWSTARIADEIYAPFPVMGPASWSDSWGAPRFAGGYHPHAGQDVLCRWGAPVIAIEDATVTYGWNALGGNAAYLTRPDGSFWYYAHLSRTRDSLAGTAVAQGDIIGRCGATGDATVPHVHFGFESADGTMLDTLHALRVTLRLAEARLYRPPAPPHDVDVPTPDPASALPIPWPKPTIAPQPAPAPMDAMVPEVGLATGVLVALGVLGPLAFLYRRTRRITLADAA